MSVPSEATTVTGGCSCGAIRYRITIPEASQRPSLPFAPPEAGLQMPYSTTCHCNDCRRASASLLPLAIVQVPMPMVTVSVLEQPHDADVLLKTGRVLDVLDENYDQAEADAKRPAYEPSADVLRATEDNGARGTWLRFWHSFDCSSNFSRSFCGRCGTQVGFHLRLRAEYCYGGKLPNGWGDIYDINVGTVDREFLDKEWFQPQSEVNFKHGIPFGKKVAATALGLRHLEKSYSLDPEEGMASEADLRQLTGL